MRCCLPGQSGRDAGLSASAAACFCLFSGRFSSSGALTLMKGFIRRDTHTKRHLHAVFAVVSASDGTLMSAERTGCPPAAPTHWSPAPSSRCARPPASWSARPLSSSSSRKCQPKSWLVEKMHLLFFILCASGSYYLKALLHVELNVEAMRCSKCWTRSSVWLANLAEFSLFWILCYL